MYFTDSISAKMFQIFNDKIKMFLKNNLTLNCGVIQNIFKMKKSQMHNSIQNLNLGWRAGIPAWTLAVL